MGRQKKNSKKTSLADIASYLGVSKTLVSMVLNNRGDEHAIAKETQRKVWEVSEKLDYKPNQIARGLRTGKSNSVGLIVADISNPFYAKIARHLEDNCSKHGYNLIICSSDEDPVKEKKLIDVLRNRQVDGIILSSTLKNGRELKGMIYDNYPFVLIDRYFSDIDTNYVLVDNEKSSFDAVKSLIDSGYKRIAHLSITPFHASSIADRRRGFRMAQKMNGIKYDNWLLREIPFNNIKESVFEEVKDLLSGPKPADAIFTVNNNIAVACLEALQKLKKQIPTDVALLSFDDIDLFKFTNPSISAIAQPIEEISKSCVEILINQINNKDDISRHHVILNTNLIKRDSCLKQ